MDNYCTCACAGVGRPPCGAVATSGAGSRARKYRHLLNEALRVEDPELIDGRSTFVDDLRIPGTAHAVFVRSPLPHARNLEFEPRRRATLTAPSTILSLPHPDAPGERPDLLIIDRTPSKLERQFDLTVMVAFVPNHVLQEEDWMVIMKVHFAAVLHFALYRIPHSSSAIV